MSRKKANLLYLIGAVLLLICIISMGKLITEHGEAARSMPLLNTLLAISILSLIPLYLGYYHTTWKDITGGLGKPNQLIIFILATSALGIILNVIRRIIFK